MGKFDRYKVGLKDMTADAATHEFTVDNRFFEDMGGEEVRKGKLKATVGVRKAGGMFLLDFRIEGVVVITCDRCLDDMEMPVSATEKLNVKLGDNFADEKDVTIIPEADGYINVAGLIYEYVILSIPMKHVHEPGKCNKGMLRHLKEHQCAWTDEEEAEEERDSEETAPRSGRAEEGE